MDVFTFLTQNRNTRKLFGRRELKIIEKQLWGINLTQSEKNRLSRDIRPKFAFIKEAARFEEEFDFRKSALLKEKIASIKSAIMGDELHPKIKKIILYGSVVERQLTFRSDIDIAVVFDRINVTEATKFRIRALGKSPEKADIQVYNTLPEKIKKEIDLKGKVIYERENQR